MANDAGRAVCIMEAGKDLAKVLVLDEVYHRSVAAGDKESDVTIGAFRDHGCQCLRMLELIDALYILEGLGARGVIATEEHLVIGVGGP